MPDSAPNQEKHVTALKRKHGVAVTRTSLERNDQLEQALKTASEATKWIEPEQARLRLLLEEAKTETEIAAREFQIRYVERYLTRAEDLAKKRIDHLSQIQTEADVEH